MEVNSDFITALLSLNIPVSSLLTFFLLGFCRMAPLVLFCPFLGGKIAPMIGRAGLAIFLSIIFLPLSIFSSSTIVDYNASFPFYAIKELLIGFVLAFLTSLPFFVAESSGIIIDFARGASSMMGQNVLTQDQASSIGVFYNYLLIYFFYFLDGPALFYEAIAGSYNLIPTAELLPKSFFNLQNGFWHLATVYMQQLFTISIQLAAPVLVAILMTDIFLGIANRLAPQVQISFLGQALKSLMALFLLWLGWAFILKNMNNEMLSFAKHLNQLIENLGLQYRS